MERKLPLAQYMASYLKYGPYVTNRHYLLTRLLQFTTILLTVTSVGCSLVSVWYLTSDVSGDRIEGESSSQPEKQESQPESNTPRTPTQDVDNGISQ